MGHREVGWCSTVNHRVPDKAHGCCADVWWCSFGKSSWRLARTLPPPPWPSGWTTPRSDLSWQNWPARLCICKLRGRLELGWLLQQAGVKVATVLGQAAACFLL
ncbi:hypothetical protein HaLaN_12623 [Haematococcus lacustris]|uniref:Uncharacterized protein n=1 Tax=Haematococcus lacustris TaxID=44745 RepID=A0A699Z2G5_HAELA|nr:hypothetical protein HaLaN_12623 [Haematococcus lacustris]